MEPRRYQIVPQEPNKRRFPRVHLSDSVQLHFGKDMPQGALSCDISSGGLRLKANRFFPIGSNLHLSVRLDAEKTLVCKGKVMWISCVPFAENEQYNVGVAFDAQSLADNSYDLNGFLDRESS